MDSKPSTNGPHYVLALYDGNRHVGYAPRHGAGVIGNPKDPAVDTFFSVLGVRTQARARVVLYSPLTVAPFDLSDHKPLDPIPGLEEPAMPLKDEETREAIENPVTVVIDKTVRRSRERDELLRMTRRLISAQYTLAKMLDRFSPQSEG